MNYNTFAQNALVPALRMLPGWMDTQEARAQILAICLQESDLRYRKQVGGPAKGYAQFETGGIQAVLHHATVGPVAKLAMERLDYYGTGLLDGLVVVAYTAVEHNDILTCVFARLLLSADPQALPKKTEPQKGWEQYLRSWRPGKPHPEKWPACFSRAWNIVETMGGQ